MKNTIIDYLMVRANYNKKLHDAIMKHDVAYINNWMQEEKADEYSTICMYKDCNFNIEDLAKMLKVQDAEVNRLIKKGLYKI